MFFKKFSRYSSLKMFADWAGFLSITLSDVLVVRNINRTRN